MPSPVVAVKVQLSSLPAEEMAPSEVVPLVSTFVPSGSVALRVQRSR